MAKKSRQGRKTILGKKVGMTQIFSEDGQFVPVTVLQAGPCVVLQVKTEDKDGYSAVQLGFDETRKQRKRPQQALFDRIGVAGQRFVREIPYVDPADVIPPDSAAGGSSADGEEASGGAAESAAGGLAPGSRIRVGAFKKVARVDVRGVTKGRGFAGNIKRHGFASGDKAHGSKNVRQPGSTGMHTDPGRVAKGKKMPGHLGNVWRKAMNLTVVGIEEEDNLMLVKGALPGPNGGYVYIEESLV
jgi:large subunit ribosomal protein L3